MQLFEIFGSVLLKDNDASKKLGDIDSKAGEVSKSLSKGIGTVAKWGAAVAFAASTAAVAVVGLAVNVGEDLQKALNGLQAQTGSTDEAMTGMKDSMLAIYNNNFGEDFEDIGVAMATVAKATGLAGKELESATQNALMLRDTFEMDVSGSINAVNQLMDQFGMTSEQAYNLLAQGAQNGMNANDDLTDIIKEYSVQFKTMGFTAEEMFNMLSNGAKKGGFSIDVMGDAMKEFNIRSKDGSKASNEAFKSLGLNADNLTKSFAKGGEEGKKAFSEVIKKLKGMKDPVEQNQAGVALFGTMWEDLGAKAILAMGDTKGGIESVEDALERINSGKYDTFGEAMQGIKRNIETGILIPIGDAVLPALKKFSAYIVENMPIIKKYITDMTKMAIKKFDKIVTVVKDIAENIFPNMQTKSFDLKEEVKSLVTKGFDIMITALTWIRDNIPLIKGVVVVLTAKWLIQKGVLIAHNIALLAHNVQTLIAKGRDIALTAAIVALYIAQGIATGATIAFSVAVAFLTSPIGIVVLAIGALIAIGVLLWKNWDVVSEKLSDFVFGMKNAFSNVGTFVANIFKGMANDFIDSINTMIGLINKLPGVQVGMVDKYDLGTYKSLSRPSAAARSYRAAKSKTHTQMIGQYAIGSKYIPYDMDAKVHEGELIVPKAENPYANSGGQIMPGAGGGFNLSIENLVGALDDLRKIIRGESGKGNTTNYNAPLVQVANMTVNDKNDVRAISSELYNLQQNADRSRGK